MAEGEPVAEEEEVPASIQYFRTGQEELVKRLRQPAVDLLRALVEMVVAPGLCLSLILLVFE
jgi:hypothetical protein